LFPAQRVSQLHRSPCLRGPYIKPNSRRQGIRLSQHPYYQFNFYKLLATPWLALLANHAVMLVIALALIARFSRRNFSEYGLKWPKQRQYVLSALFWGAAFGLLMTFVDYFPQILRHIPPPDNLALTPGSIGAWLFFQGIYVGPTEEIHYDRPGWLFSTRAHRIMP
jgi:hypothetical protein